MASELWKAALSATRNRTAPTIPPPFLKETASHFSPVVMSSLLRLKQNVFSVEPGPVRTLLTLGFASILIDCSNLKRAPCLGYTTKLGMSADLPFELFLQQVAVIKQDLVALRAKARGWGPPLEVIQANSGMAPIPEGAVDLAITSPPYVNGMDYVTNYKLDLAWLDFIKSYDELRTLRAAMVACDNIPRETAASHQANDIVRSDVWVGSVAKSIDSNIETKAAYRRDDMGAIVTKYFSDLVPVIENVYQSLKPGGRFVVVNGDSLIAGTYIPGDAIFGRLAEKVGFEVEAFDVARERRSGQRRGFVLRETILVLAKPGRRKGAKAPRKRHSLDDFAPPN